MDVESARTTGSGEAISVSRWIAPALPALLVALAYYFGARLGFALTFHPRPVSTLWPPNAILLAALLLTPKRSWWSILLAALLAHLAAELHAGVPWPMVLCWFVSNSSEALFSAVAIRHFVRRPLRFDDMTQVAVFVAFGGFLGPFLSSFPDAAFVHLNGWGEAGFWDVWQARFSSNFLAALTIAPAILTCATSSGAALREAPLRRYVEAGLLAMGLLVVSAIVFGGQAPGPNSTPALLYAPLPFLLWAAVRFGPTGASLSLLAVVLLAMSGAVHGRGPFAHSPAENAFTIKLLFVILSIGLLSLAAVIDERRSAEDAARKSGARLQLALDAAHMGTWELDSLRGSRELSTESRRIFGFAPVGPHVTADEFLSRIHPDDRPAASTALARTLEQGAPYDAEFRIVRPDGMIRWVLGRGKVTPDRTGRPSRVIGLYMDITDSRKAAALSAGQTRVLEILASGAPLGVVLTELAILVESQSDGMLCAVTLLDDNRVHLRHAAAPSLPESFDRALATQNGLRSCWSTPIVSHQGEVLGSFAMYYREVRSPNSWERHLIEIAVQIARLAIERTRAQQALHESQQRYQLATVAGDVGVWDWHIEENDIYVDPHLKHVLGYADHEIGSDATGWARLVHRDDIDRLSELVRACLAGESAQYEIEHRMLHSDGSCRWFLTRASVVRDPDGRPHRLLGTSTDVTGRKDAELDAQEQRRELAHLGRVAMLGELSGALAHELNQPLGAIMVNAGVARRLLAMEQPDLVEVRDILQDIISDGRRAGDVIVHLRALIRRDELRLQRIGLGELAADTVAFMHSDLIERQVSVEIRPTLPLPTVLGDRVQLQQVLLNLIINACEVMSAKSPHERRITVGTALTSHGSVQLYVADRGPGIPEGRLDRLLEPFFSTTAHGLGLGLAICRSIIDAHGGKIEAGNRPGGGSVFTVTLPAAGDTASLAADRRTGEPQTAARAFPHAP